MASPGALCCLVLCLFVGASMANHNDLERLGPYNAVYETYNLGYGSYNLNQTLYPSRVAYGGCAIEYLYMYDNNTYTDARSNAYCVGQWMVDGSYMAIFDLNAGGFQDFSDDDDDRRSDEGPIFTSTGDPLDYYTYLAGQYDPDIGLHSAVTITPDGTTVMYSGFRNLGGSTRTISINAGPRQYFSDDPVGNGWALADDTESVTTTSDGDSTVENTDTFVQVSSGELLLTVSTHGTLDTTGTQQAIYYDTVNPENPTYGPSGELEMEVTHTLTLAPGETKAVLTFIQSCFPDLPVSCSNKAANLIDEEAIFNAGYTNWLGSVQLSQVVNYNAVTLATGMVGGDPHMTPLTGTRRTKDIHGAHGAMLNVISDSDLVMNMRLKELAAFKALGAEATFIEALAVQFEAGDQLLLTVADGVGYQLTLNGEELAVGDSVAVGGARIMVLEVPAQKSFQGWFNARYKGHNLQAMVHVITENYNIELFPVYKDSFTNWHTAAPGEHTLVEQHSFLDMDVSLLKETSEARGILGETAHPSFERDTQTFDERVQHYTVSDLFDSSFQ